MERTVVAIVGRKARQARRSVTLSAEQLRRMTTREIFDALGVRPADDLDHSDTSAALDAAVYQEEAA
jgi:hypothetical protein